MRAGSVPSHAARKLQNRLRRTVTRPATPTDCHQHRDQTAGRPGVSVLQGPAAHRLALTRIPRARLDCWRGCEPARGAMAAGGGGGHGGKWAHSPSGPRSALCDDSGAMAKLLLPALSDLQTPLDGWSCHVSRFWGCEPFHAGGTGPAGGPVLPGTRALRAPRRPIRPNDRNPCWASGPGASFSAPRTGNSATAGASYTST